MEREKIVLLIMGSVRAGRLCPNITDWIEQIGEACTDFAYEVIDLADWPLPMDDEPAIPALGPYAQPHTHVWSDKITRADALVFVTPQYNWGYPAVLKNAIDHLYREWRDKPTVIVTYGGHGGTRCAKQLRQIAVSVKMRVVTTTPAVRLPDTVIQQRTPLDPDRDLEPYRAQVQHAFAQLTTLVNGRDRFLAKFCRKWKAMFIAAT